MTWYVSGQYGYGRNAESHAWLETESGTLIDITGDQYWSKESPLMFREPVYVGDRTIMHKAFRLDEPIPYMMEISPLGKSSLEIMKDKAYDSILRRMQYR